MIEESTFSKNDLYKEVLDNYNIKVKDIDVITNGSANIYKLYSDKNTYILKEFQSNYDEKDVLREINAIQYLEKSSEIPVPEYKKCNNGKFYFKHNGRVVIVQKFIEGKVCKKNEGNYSELLESASYLGQIIKGFDGMKIEDSINVTDWYSDAEIERSMKKYNLILEKVGNTETEFKIKEDILFKKKLLYGLKIELDSSEIEKITHRVSHGDYSCLQFIYDENNKVKAILDFIKVKKLPIVWEIARSYSYIDKEAKDGKINIQNLVEYTKEISKIIDLNKNDLKYLPYVYLIQLARSTYGYEEYFKKVENKDELLSFAFYRTNICRDLNEKAKDISNKLLEL